MNMKLLLSFPLLVAIMACDGPAIANNSPPDAGTTAIVQTADASQLVYHTIDRVIQDPKILRLNWAGMSTAFPAQCAKKGTEPELICPPVEGIQAVSVLSSGAGLVDWVLTHPVSCQNLYDLIAKRYGPGKLQDGDKCRTDWNLSSSVKGAYIRLSKSRKQADKIFLQFGIEQGP